MGVRTVDVREVTVPISSRVRNAYIDFSEMTTSLVAVVTDAVREGQDARNLLPCKARSHITFEGRTP